MATNKPFSTLIIFLNLAMFTVISTHAKCPDLTACMSMANNLVGVQVGSKASTSCCQLIGRLVGAKATACLCTSLQTSNGGLLPSVLGILGGLPLLGAILGPLLGGSGSILGSATSVLNKEVLVYAHACGLDATKFKC